MESPFVPKPVAEIAGDAFRVYKLNFLQILAISAVASVVLLLLDLVFDRFLFSGVEEEFAALSQFGSSPPEQQLINALIEQLPALIAFGGLYVLLSFIINLLKIGAMIHAVSEQHIQRPIKIIRPYTFAFKRLLPVIGVSILIAIAIIAMSITIIGIPFAIYFGVRWSFIIPAVLLEGKGPISAISRSSDLVHENWWRVFGFLFVVTIVIAIASVIVGFALGRMPVIGDFIVNLIFLPAFAILQIMLYFDLRIREDGSDKFNLETLTGELKMHFDGNEG